MRIGDYCCVTQQALSKMTPSMKELLWGWILRVVENTRPGWCCVEQLPGVELNDAWLAEYQFKIALGSVVVLKNNIVEQGRNDQIAGAVGTIMVLNSQDSIASVQLDVPCVAEPMRVTWSTKHMLPTVAGVGDIVKLCSLPSLSAYSGIKWKGHADTLAVVEGWGQAGSRLALRVNIEEQFVWPLDFVSLICKADNAWRHIKPGSRVRLLRQPADVRTSAHDRYFNTETTVQRLMPDVPSVSFPRSPLVSVDADGGRLRWSKKHMQVLSLFSNKMTPKEKIVHINHITPFETMNLTNCESFDGYIDMHLSGSDGQSAHLRNIPLETFCEFMRRVVAAVEASNVIIAGEEVKEQAKLQALIAATESKTAPALPATGSKTASVPIPAAPGSYAPSIYNLGGKP